MITDLKQVNINKQSESRVDQCHMCAVTVQLNYFPQLLSLSRSFLQNTVSHHSHSHHVYINCNTTDSFITVDIYAHTH